MNQPTYRLGEKDRHSFIQCLICTFKSFHPKDIQHRYCGNCKRFHPILDTPEDRAADFIKEKLRWLLH